MITTRRKDDAVDVRAEKDSTSPVVFAVTPVCKIRTPAWPLLAC
jgi:hypothetical protein